MLLDQQQVHTIQSLKIFLLGLIDFLLIFKVHVESII